MRLRNISLLLLIGTFMLVGACGNSKPAPKQDGPKAQDVNTPPADSPQYPPGSEQPKPGDTNQPTPEGYQWPDHQPVDHLPGSDYTAGPFGCQTDSDCFGQKCCPTPWGVKLCSPSCDLK